jgi:hypothetical protein
MIVSRVTRTQYYQVQHQSQWNTLTDVATLFHLVMVVMNMVLMVVLIVGQLGMSHIVRVELKIYLFLNTL